MDFQSILSTAGKNAQKASKGLREADDELARERRMKMKQLERQKREKEEEARRRKRAAPPPPEPPKFQIPKKNQGKEVAAFDKERVQAFLAKKKAGEKAKEKSEEEKREQLIRLRIQANGGKASKEMGRHFGMSALELQMRFGNDREHEERLRKQQYREEEEADALADRYRDGVYKALAQKQKVEDKVRRSNEGVPKHPHRVSTSKTNSLAGLSSRHAHARDNFSPPPEEKKKKPAFASAPAAKKRPAPPPVDFAQLMRAAEDISKGKKPTVALTPVSVPPPVKKAREELKHQNRPDASRGSSSQQRPSSSSMSASRPKEREDERARSSNGCGRDSRPQSTQRPSGSSSIQRPNGQSSSSQRPNGQSSSSTSLKDKEREKERMREKEKAKHKDKSDDKEAVAKDGKKKREYFKKGPTPPPLIPPPVPGKRYLPGDARYKMQQDELKKSGGGGGASSSSSRAPPAPASVQRARAADADRERERASSSKMASSSSADRRPKIRDWKDDRPLARDEKEEGAEKARREERRRREREMESASAIRAQQKMKHDQYRTLRDRERERERERSRNRNGGYYGGQYDDDEDLDDEEYDSELDDFIDDTPLDVNDLSRKEMDETLAMLNKNYDKKRWAMRERMIDDRQMEANFHSISREEARSARLGLKEDLEAVRDGNSEML